MNTREDIQNTLRRGGYQETDITLGSLLSKRAMESHLNLGFNIVMCRTCMEMGKIYRPVTGIGPQNSPLMIISSMPGLDEEESTVPFVGAEGQLLSFILAKQNIDRNAIYMTYASKVPIERASSQDIAHMKEHFLQEIDAVNPSVILTLGGLAMQVVDTPQRLSDVRGSLQEVNYKTQSGTKSVKLIHTYDLRHVLEPSESISAYKKAIWNDLGKAISTVRELKPDYVYDRVGLHEVMK